MKLRSRVTFRASRAPRLFGGGLLARRPRRLSIKRSIGLGQLVRWVDPVQAISAILPNSDGARQPNSARLAGTAR